MSQANDFVITVATANGSGSQSSNTVLLRALFRMGVPVGGKNLFPSNIQGLPTWFTIRANSHGFTARRKLADIAVAMNAQTAAEDMALVHAGGFFFLNAEIKLAPTQIRSNIQVVSVPFRDIVAKVTDSTKLKKLLVNMVYVGVLAELLKIPAAVVDDVVQHQFGDKASVIEMNLKAIAAGREYAKSDLSALNFPYRAEAVQPAANKAPALQAGKILIDGNSAAAMGLVFGGCTFVAWYPITPSSSLVESFIEMAEAHRLDKNGKRQFAVVQAEDELASISMVLGAGWSGARAMTATSGPGLSLMSEAAGLAYYAEIPAVIWDVQRVGPSTGLPTRTMQGDLLSAYYLSHGDTKHVVLLPADPKEAFEFGQTAFDLAERLQTLVIVMSDLDLGMNLRACERFEYPSKPFDRGKVLAAADLEKLGGFKRYADVDHDGIGYRTLPGTVHPKAAYFTRGTGHDESSFYSEKAEHYAANMKRLELKFETAKQLVPAPVISPAPAAAATSATAAAKVALLYYGSSHEAIAEVVALLQEQAIAVSTLRLRALPLSAEVERFIAQHDRVYVVEQNRDAQLLTILRAELPRVSSRLRSVLHFDGMPLDAETVVEQVVQQEAACRPGRLAEPKGVV
jgi:2-oxoglutarate ferredoxin oxidoreductase subunit alpha